MKKIFYIIAMLTLVSCSETLSDFQSTNFIKFFGNGDGSSVNSVIETSDGYVFTGYDSYNGRKQLFIAKTNKYGNTLWSRLIESDSIQEGQFVKRLGDDTFIIAGNSQATATSNSTPFIMNIASNGETIWQQYIDSTNDLKLNDIYVADQSIFIAGQKLAPGATATNYFAANYTTSGQQNWSYTSVASGAFKKIHITTDGKCYLIGNDTYSAIPNITINKVNNNNPISDIVRKITFDRDFNGIADIVYDNHNLYLLVDNKTNGTQVIKLNENFADVWTSDVLTGNDASITPKTITRRNNNTLMVCGNKDNNIMLLGFDTNGTLTSSDKYRSFYGNVNSIITTSDDGLLIAGTTSEAFYEMMQLIKTDNSLYLFEQ